MRKKFRILLEKMGYAIMTLGKLTYSIEQEKRTIPWFKDQGDKTLRLNYDLNNDDIVFDIGGYEGQWASDIFSKYCCSIHIFEPVPEFALNIKKRFSQNHKIFVWDFGLADNSYKTSIETNQDATSVFKSYNPLKKNKFIEIKLISALEFMQKNKIDKVQLMKINIEGGEYDLLDHLIEFEFVKYILNIQIQFHDFVDDAEQRMIKIQKHLSKTHRLTYQYPFVWENWERIET